MSDVMIISATRTPIGRAIKGSLADVRPDDLAAAVVRAAVKDSGIDPAALEDHILGTAYPEGKQGANLARRVVPLAGLPLTIPGATVNRFCASSLQALRIAAHAIRSGEASAQLVSGVESLSQVGRTTREEDKHPRLVGEDSPDMYMAMGVTAENVATRYGIRRNDMDALALRSHRLAVAAQDDGSTAREITPVAVNGSLITRDDGPRRDTSLSALAALPPVFTSDGSVTAGNSCPLNDGAAAAVLTSAEFARAHDLHPRARIIASAVAGVDPAYMGIGPIPAVRRVLALAGISIAAVDAVEFNEAFSSQVLASASETGMDIDRQVNLRGGSLALGHPFGMTGVRLITTLLTTLEVRDGTVGLATLCVGGGQGMAMLVERL